MSEKKGNVGPDGLTKKERRALKVQAKQSTDPKPPEQVVEPKKETVVKPPVTGNAKPKDTKNAPTAKPVDAPKPTGELSEKEKRKLEWEKKLAEQNSAQKPKEGEVSKADLKKLRREQQEAQRQAKATVKIPAKPTAIETKRTSPEKVTKTAPKTPAKKELPKKAPNNHRVQLVQHLYTDDLIKSEFGSIIVNYKNVHPAFIKLGAQYSTKTILGSNARCLALLGALKQLVNDLQTPPKQEFCRYLESVLQTCTSFINKCRPPAVSMTNALRHFKLQLTHINNKLSDNEKKAQLDDVIDTYIHDDIHKAGDAISMKVNEKICNGDVIMTYGCSSLIRKILLDAHAEKKQFQVIIVDGRPLLEGRELLRRLSEVGIPCTYILITALSYAMQSVSKVLLGSHAILTNGHVMSRVGTAQVAMVASAFNKPVLVCCETYKFSERVQTDAFVHNEIGDEQDLIHIDTVQERSPLAAWKDTGRLAPLNLLYDVTPPDLVTAVVTEIAILPCTSVPVVLRINAIEAN